MTKNKVSNKKDKHDKWMTIKEISLMCAIPVETLRRWCREQTIPSKLRQVKTKTGKKYTWYINIGQIIRSVEIKYFFEKETGQDLDMEDLENMHLFSLKMEPSK